MSPTPDHGTKPIVEAKVMAKHTDPMVQGATAALIDVQLHLLDAVQGDQLCHMRTVLNVLSSRKIIAHLTREGQLVEARKLTAEWYHLNSQKKLGDEAFLLEYSSLVKTCEEVIGGNYMEIAKLCFDITRDVTWVFTPMGISTYFRNQGHVSNKAKKQGHLQQLCIEAFEEIVGVWCRKAPENRFLAQLQKALGIMYNHILQGGENIPVLNFFIASLMVELIDFTYGTIRAVAVRRMEIQLDSNTIILDKILILYFRHDQGTGCFKPTILTDDEKHLPLMLYQAWSKYHTGQDGSGLYSQFNDEYTKAVGQCLGKILLHYITLHPPYANSINHDGNETQKLLKEICGNYIGSDASILSNFSFYPSHNHASLFDVWTQACNIEANLGAGKHKPLETIITGKIYKETTQKTAFNIDHIIGATAIKVETWAAFIQSSHARAGNPKLGYYLVVAGSTTLPCSTEEEANQVAANKDRKRKKDFVEVHPALNPILGMSWDGAFA